MMKISFATDGGAYSRPVRARRVQIVGRGEGLEVFFVVYLVVRGTTLCSTSTFHSTKHNQLHQLAASCSFYSLLILKAMDS